MLISVIKRTLRESDVTFRYGGDEFVMVLGNTSLKDAMMVAERVRQQIEKKRFLARDKMDIRLTASIGVATFPEHGASKKDILRAADAAMYGVKRQHRNKVLAAEFIGK
jgi:diguanylate cyclase (GGDEF)-like protein